MAKKLNTRAASARIVWQVVDHGKSLDAVLNDVVEQAGIIDQNRGFVQELSYGVLRWYWPLNRMSEQLLRSPIRKKDRVIHFTLLVGLYQLAYLKTADHAAVSETVKACLQLGKGWAKNLINGCLRQFIREPISTQNVIDENQSHPRWLKERIEMHWPEQTDQILAANNLRPPLCLRVNKIQSSRSSYLDQLISADLPASPDSYSSDGIRLENSTSIAKLPNFKQGFVSVQDTAAQLACEFLSPQADERILDACAAPGGKTAHILEYTNNSSIVDATDIAQSRVDTLNDTLKRLRLKANTYVADASELPTWPTPATGYDRILIDAPCSGVGVIRRHPDIKHHRKNSDIEYLTQIQSKLLDNLWHLLKKGGRLLYMTCSILPEENNVQIAGFLKRHNDVNLIAIDHPNALALDFGVQTLPGVHDMDGFYYCLFEKMMTDNT